MVTWQSAGVGSGNSYSWMKSSTVCSAEAATTEPSVREEELSSATAFCKELIPFLTLMGSGGHHDGSKTLYKWSTVQVCMWSAYHLHRSGPFSTSSGRWLLSPADAKAANFQARQLWELNIFANIAYCARCGAVVACEDGIEFTKVKAFAFLEYKEIRYNMRSMQQTSN